MRARRPSSSLSPIERKMSTRFDENPRPVDRLADDPPAKSIHRIPAERLRGRLGAQQLVRQTSLAVANAQSPPGECFVFGTGDNGQLGMGDDLLELMRPRLLDTIPGVNAASVIKICCGGMHTLAVCQGGVMYSWGVNDEGALGRVTKKDAVGRVQAGVGDAPVERRRRGGRQHGGLARRRRHLHRRDRGVGVLSKLQRPVGVHRGEDLQRPTIVYSPDGSEDPTRSASRPGRITCWR